MDPLDAAVLRMLEDPKHAGRVTAGSRRPGDSKRMRPRVAGGRKLMMNIRIALAAVVVGFAFAGPANAQSATDTVALEATDLLSMSVNNLREPNCGGVEFKIRKSGREESQVRRMRDVLGVVDMLRDWQRLDPTRAPSVCVPRNVTSGQLILVDAGSY
jgi:hypothetical protein